MSTPSETISTETSQRRVPAAKAAMRALEVRPVAGDDPGRSSARPSSRAARWRRRACRWPRSACCVGVSAARTGQARAGVAQDWLHPVAVGVQAVRRRRAVSVRGRTTSKLARRCLPSLTHRDVAVVGQDIYQGLTYRDGQLLRLSLPETRIHFDGANQLPSTARPNTSQRCHFFVPEGKRQN